MNTSETQSPGMTWSIREVQEKYSRETIAKNVGQVLGLDLSEVLNYPWKSPYRRPVILEISEGEIPRGYLFLWKVYFFGFSTGLLSDFQAPGIISRNEDREKVLRMAFTYILTQMKARRLELRVPLEEKKILEALMEVLPQKREWIITSHENVDRILDLPVNFDQLLANWGYKMRRNVRHYLRLCGDNGWTYLPKMDWKKFYEDALFLTKKSDLPKWTSKTLGNLNKLAVIPGAFCAGLYKDSEPLSVIAGWRYGDKVMVLFQLNLPQRSGLSLSMTLRSQMIRDLTIQQVKQVVFLSGASEPLKRYCEEVPRFQWSVRRSNWFWDPIESYERKSIWKLASLIPGITNRKNEEEAEE
jgi:hypothetical protein